jgi:hypothetical protein
MLSPAAPCLAARLSRRAGGVPPPCVSPFGAGMVWASQPGAMACSRWMAAVMSPVQRHQAQAATAAHTPPAGEHAKVHPLDSQHRAGPARASICGQAIKPAHAAISHHASDPSRRCDKPPEQLRTGLQRSGTPAVELPHERVDRSDRRSDGPSML